MCDISYLGSSLILTSIVGGLHGFNLKTYAASTWLASTNFRVVKRKIRKIEKRNHPATPQQTTHLYTFPKRFFFWTGNSGFLSYEHLPNWLTFHWILIDFIIRILMKAYFISYDLGSTNPYIQQITRVWVTAHMCQGLNSLYIGNKLIPPLVRILIMDIYIYIYPYHWGDDYPLSYGNSGNLDPSTYKTLTGRYG